MGLITLELISISYERLDYELPTYASYCETGAVLLSVKSSSWKQRRLRLINDYSYTLNEAEVNNSVPESECFLALKTDKFFLSIT